MTYLTERQRDILQFIRDFQKERGVTPTHREICDHFGFSSYGTVYKHLSLLQKKGLIKRDWNQKRGVEVIEQNAQGAKPAAAASAGVLELPLSVISLPASRWRWKSPTRPSPCRNG